MPKIDTGPTDGPPGPAVSAAWVTLSQEEAEELRASLNEWAAERNDGGDIVGWHTHVTDAEGNELTIAVGDA